MNKLGQRYISVKKPKRLLPGISVCMIVKNEDKNLNKCLSSVADLVNEVIVVDTGSTDTTWELANKLGAKTFKFKWVDDFAAARNFSLHQATREWILVLDADETISFDDHPKIMSVLNKPFDAYLLTKRSYVNRPDLGGFMANDREYEEAVEYMGWCAEPNHLLFRNTPKINYNGIIHETISDSLIKSNARVAALDVPIHHYGRWDMSKKEDYYFRMCRIRAKQENTGHAWSVFGAHLDWFGKFTEADECFTKALELDPEYWQAQFGLGLVNFKRNHMSKAKMYFEEFLTHASDDLAVANLIQIYLFENARDKATELYENSTKGFLPSKVFGQMLLQLRDVGAKSYFKRALELIPTDKEVLLLYNQCLTVRELSQEALSV